MSGAVYVSTCSSCSRTSRTICIIIFGFFFKFCLFGVLSVHAAILIWIWFVLQKIVASFLTLIQWVFVSSTLDLIHKTQAECEQFVKSFLCIQFNATICIGMVAWTMTFLLHEWGPLTVFYMAGAQKAWPDCTWLLQNPYQLCRHNLSCYGPLP